MRSHHFVLLAAIASGCTDTSEPSFAERTDGTVVSIDSGKIRGVPNSGGFAYRGIPYAAPPTGNHRWKAPRPVQPWHGVRDASVFAASCPQGNSPTKGPQSEDCLYLNVYTPPQQSHHHKLPVFVWIHGGGFLTGAGRDYEPTKLAAEGMVVVTINYRLGALGWLSHPALGETSGNYGLMDQQASLRWVRDNIGEFGGDKHDVTIAGESAGGLAVLMHLLAHDSRGLFDRAIVESGSFALTQRTLAEAEIIGQTEVDTTTCANHNPMAQCLRTLPLDELLSKFPATAIPGTVDGKVLTESLATALPAGRFTKVPVLNGSNHDEELLFVFGLLATVSQGTQISLLGEVTPETYQDAIIHALGVTPERAAAIAAEYPVGNYPLAPFALSALVGDASFACTALQQNRWTSHATHTFAYEFNDDAAPPRFAPIPAATHVAEVEYILDEPDAPVQAPLSADQELLAARMRGAWAAFAATGNPSTPELAWPAFDDSHVMSLVPPQPQVEADFSARHHCSFWSVP